MIKRIVWNDYKALGNLELTFTNDHGVPYNTIILAGENGTGKTSMLDSLATFLNKGSFVPFKEIEYIANGITYIITQPPRNAEFGYHIRNNRSSGEIREIQSGRGNNENRIASDIEDIRYYGFAYSKARSGFKTEIVRSVTTQMVDLNKYEPDNQETFTTVKQLLIDLDAQDSSEWKKKSAEGGLNDGVYEDFNQSSRIYRFKNAFNSFFDNVKYSDIDNDNQNEKRVLFTKHGHVIPIDDLSTGEKQIVFRGAHLLKNCNSICGGIVLIDEPELSMHPKWQKKILEYYRSLFWDSDKKQTVQLIIATHSEYVIKAALENKKDVLVIVLSDNEGTIVAKNITEPRVLPSITSAETNYLAFGVPSIDYHIELYGYLQYLINKHLIEDCDRYIENQVQYSSEKHERIDNSYAGHHYRTLPTYIRNAIDHPDSGRHYTEEELEVSIRLLIDLCNNAKNDALKE